MALLNWSGFLERVEHNKSLALELGQDLLVAIGVRLKKLEEAITSKDHKQIEHASHALRGLLSPYGPLDLLAAIKSVEEKARAKTLAIDSVPSEILFYLETLKKEVTHEVDLLVADLGKVSAKTGND